MAGGVNFAGRKKKAVAPTNTGISPSGPPKDPPKNKFRKDMGASWAAGTKQSAPASAAPAKAAGAKVAKTKPFNSSESDNYRGPNRGLSQAKPHTSMPAATGSESVGEPTKGPNRNVGPNYKMPDPDSFSKGSAKPAYAAPATKVVQRGGVQSRYTRDSGLAMDNRRKG